MKASQQQHIYTHEAESLEEATKLATAYGHTGRTTYTKNAICPGVHNNHNISRGAGLDPTMRQISLHNLMRKERKNNEQLGRWGKKNRRACQD